MVKAGKEFDLEVIMFCDLDHFIESDYAEVRICDSGFQSVDMKIINEVKKGDIVVSGDYGVAAAVLGKKAYAISPNGKEYTDDNIERLLFERHMAAKVRRGGGKAGKHKKRTSEDVDRLYNRLVRIIRRDNI